jgi:cytoskeletal protein CcmA (bactofilin family)
MFLKAKPRGAVGKGSDFSFIGAEVTVTGDLATPGRLHLDGKVIGDLTCGALVQGESGEVRGNVVAAEARLAGAVDGSVEAGDLALAESARITGDVLYERLSVAGGAEVDGRFKRRKGAGDGSAPARAAAAAPAPIPLFAAEAAE